MNQEELERSSNSLEENGVSQLTEDQRENLSLKDDILDAIRDVFSEIDEDGNGVLSTSELGDAMTALGVSHTDDELTELMHEIDKNGDGTIDFAEFAQMISAKMVLHDPDKDLRKAFDLFDIDKDGSITTEELRAVLESLGEHLSEEDIDIMMAEADENHDGHVDFTEFCKIWTGQDKDDDTESQNKEISEANQSSTSKLSTKTNEQSNEKQRTECPNSETMIG